MNPLEKAPARPTWRLTVIAALALLSSCAEPVDPNVCQILSDNYLLDSDFALEKQDPQSKHWSTLQHAGETSFEFIIENGELTINKIGTQPWGVFRQKLRTDELGGARMAYTAEIKLDLTPEGMRAFPIGGGLSLAARSGNNRIVLLSKLNHEPRLGKTDWLPVEVIVDLPSNTKIIDLDFIHQASGVLQVRNPSFHRVDAESTACAITPTNE